VLLLLTHLLAQIGICGRLRRVLRRLILEQRQALLHAITGTVDGEDLGVVQQPIEERTGQDVVAQERSPLPKALVARQDQAPGLVAGIDQLEDELGLARAQAGIADLVDDENLGPGIEAQAFAQGVFAPGRIRYGRPGPS